VTPVAYPVPTAIRWLVVGLIMLPIGFAALFIATYSVDVPYNDEWATARLFLYLAEGSLSFTHLFAQQNEFRQFFPHLLFLALGTITRWNVRYEMLVSLLLACLVSFNIYRISRVTITGAEKRLWLLVGTNLLIFSPVQYESWLLGMQVVYFAPIACLTTCLSVAYSGLSPRAKLAIGVLLSIVSTFSSANGVLCWVLVLPVLLVVCDWRRPFVPFLIGGWIALCLLSVSFYLYGYRTLESHPSLTESLRHPAHALVYLAAFLGAPLAPGTGIPRLAAATLIGTLASIFFAGACAYLWVGFADGSLRRRIIVFVMIGAYSLGTGLMVMPARLGFGIPQALSPRYSTFSLYLLVSLIYLAPIVLEHARANGYLPSRVRTAPLVSAVVAALLLLHALTVTHGVLHARAFRTHLRYVKTCLLFVNALRCPAPATWIPPNQGDPIALANALNRLGYLRPSLIDGKSVEEIATSSQDARSAGAFEDLARTPDGRFIAYGWAVLPEGQEPAHAVLLSYQDGSRGSNVFAIASMAGVPDGLVPALRQPAHSRTRWHHTFAQTDMPTDDPTHVDAWAFDTESGKAFKLTGSHVVRPLRLPKLSLAGSTLYSVDVINDQVSPQNVVIEAKHGDAVHITGWAVDESAQREAGGVFVEVDKQLVIPALYGLDRPDVAAHFRNERYRSSGFSVFFAASALEKGRHTLSLKVMAADRRGYYDTGYRAILEIK
jgi:hypothetical protein